MVCLASKMSGDSSRDEVNDTVTRLEVFVNDILKEQLKETEETADKITLDLAKFTSLKDSLKILEDPEWRSEGFKAKVDVGCNFFMEAETKVPLKLYVDVGLDLLVLLEADEAKKAVDMRIEFLNKKLAIYRKESANIKAHIKMALLGLQQLQAI